MRRSPLRSKAPEMRPASRAPSGPAIRGYEPPKVPVQTTTASREGDAAEKLARLRSRKYLDMVKADPCEAAAQHDHCTGPIDPHHVQVRGNRDDTCDFTAIPLCRRHHDDAHAGRIGQEELQRLLGGYLCRKLLSLGRSEAEAVLREMIRRIGE